MKRYRQALVIGKFYPPHRGHRQLISMAGQYADRVSVVVMASGAESIPLEERLRWLRQDHAGDPVDFAGVRCEAPPDLYDDNVWLAQVAAMRSALRSIGAEGVDVVVSGEGYGERLAGYFSAAHVHLDREAHTVSGTKIRSDLLAGWGGLTAPARAGLACRVVVVGAESTGTTTIAAALTAHYRQRGGIWKQTGYVAEYGRPYTEKLWNDQRRQARSAGGAEPALADVVWLHSDFDAVAAGQTDKENEAAAAGSPLLICDTDAFATAIWERRYMGVRARAWPAWARPPALPRHDLYLLTSHHGVPWVDDGIREGQLEIRKAMTEWFADALTEGGHPWVLLEGTLNERIALAIRSIDPVVNRRLVLADPLTGPGFAHPRSR